MSCDDKEEPFTPSHLLVSHRLLSLPDPLCAKDLDPTYGEKQLTLCSLTRRMRYLGATLSHFWRRWRREYLTEIRESHRYNKTNGQEVIAIGDIVVVYVHELPRTLWRLGKVKQLIRGSDGAVRGALVRVNSGKKNTSFLKRPIQHLWKCVQIQVKIVIQVKKEKHELWKTHVDRQSATSKTSRI